LVSCKFFFRCKRLFQRERSDLKPQSSSRFILMGCLLQIALPSQITTETCYLDLYIQHILALQEASGSYGSGIPLVIMTSDDTHSKTQKLLEDNKYFGMSADQVHLLKQVTFMNTAFSHVFQVYRVCSDDAFPCDHL
jgi:UDP-sugar pyrophosphorylase